jgi:selenocysteine lyase/cysteine desulfurase
MDQSSLSLTRRGFLLHSSASALIAPVFGRRVEELIPSEWHRLEESGPGDEAFWRMVKRQFFIEDGLVYLNSGTYGPTLKAAYDAVCRNLFEMGANYNKAFRQNMMGEAVPKFIARVAEFVGATSDEVAFTSGTTEAMNYIANGLELKPGDEVLTTKHEHLGGVYPWLLQAKRRGVKVSQIDLKTPPANDAELLEQFERAITPRTKVLSFCHIQYTDGALLPAKQLCEMARRRGIISVVDGAQTLGMLNVRIGDLGCDFYAASFHKWLCSPYGCGLLYVRDEMRDRLWPTIVLSYSGWDAVDRDGNPGVTDITYAPNYPKALLKYSSNIEYYGSLYWTVALAMDFHNLIGRDRIEARIKQLSERALKGLQDVPGVKLHTSGNPALRTGLVSFRAAKLKTTDLFYELRGKHNIVGRFIQHPGMNYDVNRFSTHIFNTPEEIDLAVGLVREKAK